MHLTTSESELVGHLGEVGFADAECLEMVDLTRECRTSLELLKYEDVAVIAGTAVLTWIRMLENEAFLTSPFEKRAVLSVAAGWGALCGVVNPRDLDPAVRRLPMERLGSVAHSRASESAIENAYSEFLERAEVLVDEDLARRFYAESVMRRSIDIRSTDPRLAVELARLDLESILIEWTRHLPLIRSEYAFTILPDDVEIKLLNDHPGYDLTSGDDPFRPWRRPVIHFRVPSTAKWLASDPEAPPEYLSKLADSESDYTRTDVARNPSTPVDTLRRLAGDAELSVRQSVAFNARSPQVALGRLAVEDDPILLSILINNPSTPISVHRRVAEREPLLVGGHSGAADEVLRELALHSDLAVRKEIAANVGAPPDLLEYLAKDGELREDVARNPGAPEQLLRRLATHPDHMVRAGVGINRAAPHDLLLQLANDLDWRPSSAVSMNAAAPIEVRRIAQSHSDRLRYGS